MTYDEPWSGRIWGRVDCYSVEECSQAGPIPASLAEITVGSGMAYYDLSLVDGFNIDLSVSIQGILWVYFNIGLVSQEVFVSS